MPLKVIVKPKHPGDTGHTVTYDRGHVVYEGKAHQKVIAEKMMAESGRTLLTFPVAECSVDYITNEEAKAFIVKFEYLGTMPTAPLHSVGMFAPDKELLGVAVFNKTARTPPTNKVNPLTLARGANVPWAPKNSPSWFITQACELVAKDHGVGAFYAYSDPNAGETGFIYEAVLSWTRKEPSKSGSTYKYLPPTDNQCGYPHKWVYEKKARTGKCGHSLAEHLALGWKKSKKMPGKARFIKRMT